MLNNKIMSDNNENLREEDKYTLDLEEQEKEKNLPSLISKVVQRLHKDGHPVPESQNIFLGQLLRVENYSVERAAELAVRCRKAAASTFYNEVRDYEPSKYHHLFGINGVFKVLKGRDNLGRSVVLFHWGKWNPAEISFEQAITGLLLLFENLLKSSPIAQRKGLVMINDMTDYGMRHLCNTNIRFMTKVIPLGQTSLPAKIQGIHYLFLPRICYYGRFVIDQFLEERIRRIVHFHNDLSSFHLHLSPDILPNSLGGNLGESEAVDNELHKTFMDGGAELARQFVLDAASDSQI